MTNFRASPSLFFLNTRLFNVNEGLSADYFE